MKKIILIAFILSMLSLLPGAAEAQSPFRETKFDSVTAASRFTWKVLPKGTVAIEVSPDSSDVVYIAFTGAGVRGSQRKDSLNTRRVYKGQSRFFYNLDRDSIGFKGSGKVYYWVDRGEGAPGTLIQAQGENSLVGDYLALLNQSGTSAPVATVLINTTGQELTYSYSSEGQYRLISDGLFQQDKLAIITSYGVSSDDSSNIFSMVRDDDNGILISSSTGDDRLINTAIFIRIKK